MADVLGIRCRRLHLTTSQVWLFIIVGACYTFVTSSAAYSTTQAQAMASANANRGVNHGSLRSISSDALRIDFSRPPDIMPEGANGSPISSYVVEIATGRMQKHTLTLTADEGSDDASSIFQHGGFQMIWETRVDGVALASVATNCINVKDSKLNPDIVERELKLLEFVTDAQVAVTQRDMSLIYDISVDGAFDPEAQYELIFESASVNDAGDGSSSPCEGFIPAVSHYTNKVLEYGIQPFKPGVLSISTKADDFLHGYFDLSAGFEGDYSRMVSSPTNQNEPFLFQVDAGSRIVKTNADLTNIMTPGDNILILGEKRKIKKIKTDHIVLDTYHEYGTGGIEVPGFAMDNIIGVTSIETGDEFFTDTKGRNIANYVEVGDYVKVMDGFGIPVYFQVASKSGDTSTIQLTTSYDGPPTITSIWIRKSVSVPYDASSAFFKRALETLPEIGQVSVDRRGPSKSFGYTWLVTLDSNGQLNGCPESCIIAQSASQSYISVGGGTSIGVDANTVFVQGDYINGRPVYTSLTTSHRIIFDPDLRKWELKDSTNSLSDVLSDSVIAPFVGWSGGLSMSIATSPVALLGGKNPRVTIKSIFTGVQPNFHNIVYSKIVPAPISEVQDIILTWTEGDVDGFFYLSFRNPDARVKIAWDESERDVAMKLELLPSIGSVAVTKSNAELSIKWSVTFISNTGDLEMIDIHDEDNIKGVGVTIQISEVSKGASFDHVVKASLESNQTHIARIAALNAAGKGDYSDASQSQGGGMQPFAIAPLSTPNSPILSVTPMSNHDFRINFTSTAENSIYHGGDGDIFKLEWSPTGTFGNSRRVEFSLQNSLPNDMIGTFQVTIKFPSLEYSERSYPISISGASAHEIFSAIDGLKSIKTARVEEFTSDSFEIKWSVVFTQDVGMVGDFELNIDDVLSASRSGDITTSTVVTEEATIPEGYDFEYVYPNECGSLTIGESSPWQILSLTADSDDSGDNINEGSYKLAYGDQLSECIPFDASGDTMKMELLKFVGINSVHVVPIEAPAVDQFPFGYSIRVNDLPVNDQWGALRIDPRNFGAGDCEPFNAGISHRGTSFFVRERTACASALPTTQVILLSPVDVVGGSFNIRYGDKISEQIPVSSSADEVNTQLSSIIENHLTIEVVKKENYNSLNSVAWILKYSTRDEFMHETLVDDSRVIGASVQIFPLLNFTALAESADMNGDVRFHLGNEVTGPISLYATDTKILTELHYLQGVGNAEIIRSDKDDETISLKAIIDNGIEYNGIPAIAVPGDHRSMLARGDKVDIGSCFDILIEHVTHISFDKNDSAGAVMDTKYSASDVLEISKARGFTILGLQLNSGMDYTTTCSQNESDQVEITIGTISRVNDMTIERLIVMKEYTSDLKTFRTIPDLNWRGIRAQLFSIGPIPTKPGQLTLGDAPEIQSIVFRDDFPNLEQKTTLTFRSKTTVTFAWPSGDGLATAIHIQEALSLLDSTNGTIQVTLVTSSNNEYVYHIKLFGSYELLDDATTKISSTVINGDADSFVYHEILHSALRSSGALSLNHRSIQSKADDGELLTYVFRISSQNREGFGEVSKNIEAVTLLPDGKVPEPPRTMSLGIYYTSNTLSLHFQPPIHDGGEEISKYLVECDLSTSFSSAGIRLISEEISYRSEIQEIILSCTTLCSGSFTLGWGGRVTAPINLDAELDLLRTEVTKLLGIYGSGTKTIDISKAPHGFGRKWNITFGGVRGNIGLMTANDVMLEGIDPVITVKELVAGAHDIYPGAHTNEIQSITIVKKEGFNQLATGWFKVSFENDETEAISVDATADDFKERLEALSTIQTVSVEKTVANGQSSWLVTFLDLGHGTQVGSGDIGLAEVKSSAFGESSVTDVLVFENVKGSSPFAYFISGLQEGQQYFCRVFSYNAVGYSIPSQVVSGMPRSQSRPPKLLRGEVGDSSLGINWEPPGDNGGQGLDGYFLEWFVGEKTTEIQQITTSASNGISEVQVIRSRADSESITGYFTLTFGNETTDPILYDAPADGVGSLQYHLERLPSIGNVDVQRKYSQEPVRQETFAITTGTNLLTRTGVLDLTALFEVGQIIFINGEYFLAQSINASSLTLHAVYHGPSTSNVVIYTWAYGYEWYVTFSSMVGNQPLLIASPAENWVGTNSSILVKRVTEGSVPLGGTFQMTLDGWKTPPLLHNSSSREVKEALEHLPSIGEVLVSMYPNNYGSNYIITFSSEVGDVPLIAVDATNLRGPNARAGVSTVQNGETPQLYGYEYLESTVVTSTVIPDLQNGLPYTVQLSAMNSEGNSAPVSIVPAQLIPMNLPGPPSNVQLIAMSDSLIKFIWEAPSEKGGASAISKYLVQWSVDGGFSNDVSHEFKKEIVIDNSEGPTFCTNIDINPISLEMPRYGRIMAHNGYAWSEPVTSTPPMINLEIQTPGEIENAIAYYTSSIGIMVEWFPPDSNNCKYGGDGGSPITHYVLEWDDQPDFSSPASSVVLPSNALTYHLGGRDPITGAESTQLAIGGTYFLRITAFNAKGSGVPTLFRDLYSKSTAIGPLTDILPSPPKVTKAYSVSSTSMTLDWELPPLDGGSNIESFVVDHASNPQFEHSLRLEIPVTREVQSVVVDTGVVVGEVHKLHATVEVANEEQSVRSTVNGVDEVQTVTTSCDDVIPEVQTIFLTAPDNDEVQTIKLDADDIDEIQLVRIRGDDLPEIQGVTVSVPRVHEVQKLGILISNINTNGSNESTIACHNLNIGEPCQEIEDALSGTFTVSFEFDKCGGDGDVNYCQTALAQYNPNLGTISCSPGMVSDPISGGDHCVSQQITHSFGAVEGDAGTLQWALNTLIDDNGKSFMTSPTTLLKETAVTVTRSGKIKAKGACPFNSDGVAECVGEYEISYIISFDAEHSSGDVPPVTIVHSDVRVDINSDIYTQSICPVSTFAHGCTIPIGTALDANHGSFYDGASHDTAVETIKGAQPLGMVELDYECESLVSKLSGGFTMTASLDGYTVTFSDTAFVDNANKGQWLRFSDGSGGLDIYRQIASVNAVTDSFTLHEPIESMIVVNDVEFGYYFSDWVEAAGNSGVSSMCKSLRTHRTLPIDITIFQEIVSTSDWKDKLGALPAIDSTGVTVTRHLINLEASVGFEWKITFSKQPGNVNPLRCNKVSGSSGISCSVRTIQESSIVGGEFQLGTTWPHEFVEISPSNYFSQSIMWNEGSVGLEMILEDLSVGDDSIFGNLEILRTPYVPTGHLRWSGGYTWTITFVSRPGNIPFLDIDASSLVGVGVELEVSDEDSGIYDLYQGVRNSAGFIDDPGIARDGNQISGSYALSWMGNFYHPSIATESVFGVQNGGDGLDKFMALSAENMKDLLSEHIFSNASDQIVVTRSNEPSQVMGYVYSIQFVHKNVGGNVPIISYIEDVSLLQGHNAIVNVSEESVGNEIRGTFQLRFDGHTTRPIAYDATSEDVTDALNELSSISPSAVIVSRSNSPLMLGPSNGLSGMSTQVGGYFWSITFSSNIWKDPTAIRTLDDIPGNWNGSPVNARDVWESGFSKGWGKNVGDAPLIQCISSGLTTTNGDFPSEGCQVSEFIKGTEPLSGHFQLCLDTESNPNNVISVETVTCTSDISHDAQASALDSGGDGSSLEEKLEALANVGDVQVTRGDINEKNGGYTWTIQFLHDVDGPCQEKNTFSNKCNSPGNVPKLCDGVSACDTSALIGSCNEPDSCSKLTVLDISDYSNGVKPPPSLERQRIIVKDPYYVGWTDGFYVDIPEIVAEYKLNVSGAETLCIKHNALAVEVQNHIQTVLDASGSNGKVLVERVLSKAEAPNGFVYYLTFYKTGDIPEVIPISSSDTSVCIGGFSTGKSVEVESIFHGSQHVTICDSCSDGVVQRGAITVFEVENDALSGELNWNANSMEVKTHLEQVPGREVEVNRQVLDKYGSCEWTITFVKHPNSTPPGALDVSAIIVQQDPDTSGQTNLIDITENVKGSNGLGGSLQIDYGSTNGSIIFNYNESPRRLQMKLNELNVIGQVFVTRECYPSCFTGGWGGNHVTTAGTRGGFEWLIYFLKNPGNSDGYTFPPGSGDISLPLLYDVNLTGNIAKAEISAQVDGSQPLDGAFKVSNKEGSQFTEPIPYNADENTMSQSILDLPDCGRVTVFSGFSAAQKIPGIVATAELDGTALSLSGDDMRKFLTPGDIFQVMTGEATNNSFDIGDGSFLIGSSETNGSPLLTNVNVDGDVLNIGEEIRINGESYYIERNGVEVQLLTIHSGVEISQDASYTIVITVDGVKATSECISFDAGASGIEDKINSIGLVGEDGVQVTKSRGTTGIPGDAHFFKIYFKGPYVLGNLDPIEVASCPDPGSSALSYAAVRTLVNGGNIEHQRVSLSVDSGVTTAVPAIRLEIVDTNFNQIVTPCIEWGADTLDLSGTLDAAFPVNLFTIGTGGVTQVDQGSYHIASSDYIEGKVLDGDKVQIHGSCFATVASLVDGGKMILVESLSECSGSPGDTVYYFPNTKIIEVSSGKKQHSTGLTKLHLSSDEHVLSNVGIFRLEITFRGIPLQTQCYRYGEEAAVIQNELNTLFDWDGDGAINEHDSNHVIVTRDGDGDVSSSFGFTYYFKSLGSRSHPGVSSVLGTLSPQIDVIGIGSIIGCSDLTGTEDLVTSTASTINGSMEVSNVSSSDHTLNAGSRIRISGSSDSGKVFEISHLTPADGKIFLTEPFSGLSVSSAAEVYKVAGTVPRISAEELERGSSQYDYDIYFVGSHWQDLPLMTVNRFGDGTCEADRTHMIAGMNRNIDVVTIQNGGGAISSQDYAVDKVVDYTGTVDLRSIPPSYTVRQDNSYILRITVKDEDASTLWSSGQPAFKLSSNEENAECIGFDDSEDEVEAALQAFCSGGDRCLYVTKNIDEVLAPNGHIFTIYFEGAIKGNSFSIDTTTCTTSFSPADGEHALLEEVQGGTLTRPFSDNILHLGHSADFTKQGRWTKNGNSALSLYRVTGKYWMVKFNDYLGDKAPLITQKDSLPLSSTIVVHDDISKGTCPSSATIFNLKTGIPHFARAAAVSNVGSSAFDSTQVVIPSGVPQVISDLHITNALYENEVQSIHVAARLISEIQQVETSAVAIPEVQEVIIENHGLGSIQNGAFSLRFPQIQTLLFTSSSHISGGSFYLKLDYIDLSTSITQGDGNYAMKTLKTPCIPFGATSDLLQKSMEVNALQDGLSVGSVKVSRYGNGSFSSSFGYTYTISFIGDRVRGNLSLLQTDFTLSGIDAFGGSSCGAFMSSTNDAAISIITNADTKAIGSDTSHVRVNVNSDGIVEAGQYSFTLSHLGTTLETSCIEWDATADDVKNKLESLAIIDSVLVERRGSGMLSNEENSIKSTFQDTQFKAGNGSPVIHLMDNFDGIMSEVLSIGDRLQFSGQLDSDLFYRVISIDGDNATLDHNVDETYGAYEASTFSNYQYIIYFYGQGLHPDDSGVSPFIPSINFAVSSNSCDPFQTLVDNVLTNYEDSPFLRAEVYTHTFYDGGSTLPVDTNGNWKTISNTLGNALYPWVSSISTIETWESLDGGITYTLTFGDSDGDLRELVCNAGSTLINLGGSCSTRTLMNGNMISGHFYLGSSDAISHDASALEMKDAIEKDPGITNVEVHRSTVDNQGGYTWLITYAGDYGDREEPVVSSSLRGKDASVSLEEVRKGNSIGGFYRLEYGSEASCPIPFDADQVLLKNAIEEMVPFYQVAVTEVGPRTTEGGRLHHVTFIDQNIGDISLLKPSYESLTGVGAVVSVREEVKGSLSSASVLDVSFTPPPGCSQSQVQKGSCGNALTEVAVEVALDPSFNEKADEIRLIPDRSVQTVNIYSADFSSQSHWESYITGTFQLQYDGSVTSHLPLGSSASEVRKALERLPSIVTTSVSRNYSRIKLNDVCVDMSLGSSLVTCSEMCTCNFGSNGLKGDQLIQLNSIWYRVSSTYDGDEYEFHLAESFNSLSHVTYGGDTAMTNMHIYIWGGGFQWRITFHSVQGEAQMLTSPKHDLYPANSALHIDLLKCTKCLAFKNLVEWRQYYLRARAQNEFGWATYSDVSQAVSKSLPEAPSETYLEVLSGTCIQIVMTPPKTFAGDTEADTLSIIVEWDLHSDFRSNHFTNYTCMSLSYGHCEIELESDKYELFTREICGLLPGSKYYVRAAAKNAVEAQIIVTPEGTIKNHRWSLIQSAIPQDRVPDLPEILSVTPYGRNSLQLVFNQPVRNGGQEVTHYIITWDSSADLSTSLRKVVPTEEIKTLSGTSTIIYVLNPGPLLLQEWETYYIQIEAMNIIGTSLKSNIISAVLTSPPSLPIAATLTTKQQSAEPITEAKVSWITAFQTSSEDVIDGYQVEWWSNEKTSEIQTVKLQYTSILSNTEFSLSFTNSPILKKTTAMMPWDASESLVRRELMNLGWDEDEDNKIIDNIEVSRSDLINGYIWYITFGDNYHGTNEGDQVMLNGDITSNGDSGMPILAISTIQDGHRPGGIGEVQFIQLYGTGTLEGFYRLKFGASDFTPFIAHNASALELEEALELLPSIQGVSVTQNDNVNQLEIGSIGNLVHHFEISFLPNKGNVECLVVDDSGLTSSNDDASIVIVDGDNSVNEMGFKQASTRIGEKPTDYQSSGIIDPTNDEYIIEGLVTGREYYVSLSATNSFHGFGEVMFTAPSSVIAPFQIPLSPVNVILSVNTGISDSLKLNYDAPSSDGGDSILRYRVELDPTPTFDSPIIQEIPCPKSNKRTVWRIKTKAQGNSIINGGSFSLRLSGNGISYDTAEIPYDAVALAQNETGTIEDLKFATFVATDTSSSISTSPSINLEEKIFAGDRLRFSGQTSAFKDYLVATVFGDSITLAAPYIGVSGEQILTTRHYSGRGNPSTSRIYCVYDSTLCTLSAVAKSGSMQKKIEEFNEIKTKGVLVDRDGPSSMNEFIWRVTFLDDAPPSGSDFVIQPLTNSLSTLDGLSSAAIETSLDIDGESYGFCTGNQVVPQYGGLVKGLQYYARIAAINAIGYSIPASATLPKAPTIVPGRPTSVSLDVVSASELRIMFASPSDNGGAAIRKYLIEWDTSNGFANPTSTTLDYLNGGSPFFTTIDGLTMGQNYFVRVSAWNSEGYGAPQNSSPPYLNPHQPPSPPANVQFAITSDTTLTVAWMPPLSNGGDTITMYRVEWDTNASFTSINGPPHKGFVHVDASEGESYTIQLLSSKKVYFARVFAINTGGMGHFHISEPLYLSPANQVPGRVRSLAINAGPLSGQIDIHWQRPILPHHGMPCSGTTLMPVECPSNFGESKSLSNGGRAIAEYEVEYNERSDFGGSDGGRKTVSGTFTSINNLTSGRAYYIRVLARNIIGSGSFTTENLMQIAP